MRVLMAPAAEVADVLRKDPEHWYVVASRAKVHRTILATTASRIRKGHYVGVPHDESGRFDAKVAAVPGGTAAELYVRFLPAEVSVEPAP
jgi:hypothetical protein